jgi:hypothetical protein
VSRSRECTGAGTSAASKAEKDHREPDFRRKTASRAGGGRRLAARRVPAAGAAALLAFALLGAGAGAAQAVTDTFKVVFQANDNVLAGYSSGGSNFSTTLGMMAGTSPSVALLADGTYEAAFEANNDDLALSHLGGGTAATTLGMDKGTSPAIAALPGGGWVAAFQDNDNKLYLYNSRGSRINTDLGMDPGTSPSVAVQPSGAFKVVFQDNDNVLAGYSSSGSNFITTAGMKPGTSPSIAAKSDGSYEIAVEANTSDLATIHLGTGYTVNTTTLGMDAGTSPALATPLPSTGTVGAQIVSYAEGQVGYQDSPSGTYCNKFSAYWHAGSDCGNGNYSEEWCADFAAWAWRMAGVSFTYASGSGDINGAAASFYQWGAAHGTWHAAGSGYTPQPGDAVIYGLNSAGTYADHVAIVTSYTSGQAGPDVVNGDWWVSGNGSVVAAADQTTATGSDSISGYVTP